MNELRAELKSRITLNPFKKMNIKIDVSKMFKKKPKKGKDETDAVVEKDKKNN